MRVDHMEAVEMYKWELLALVVLVAVAGQLEVLRELVRPLEKQHAERCRGYYHRPAWVAEHRGSQACPRASRAALQT